MHRSSISASSTSHSLIVWRELPLIPSNQHTVTFPAIIHVYMWLLRTKYIKQKPIYCNCNLCMSLITTLTCSLILNQLVCPMIHLYSDILCSVTRLLFNWYKKINIHMNVPHVGVYMVQVYLCCCVSLLETVSHCRNNVRVGMYTVKTFGLL